MEGEEFSKIQLNARKLEQIIENAPRNQPILRNIAACIIGIPAKESDVSSGEKTIVE